MNKLKPHIVRRIIAANILLASTALVLASTSNCPVCSDVPDRSTPPVGYETFSPSAHLCNGSGADMECNTSSQYQLTCDRVTIYHWSDGSTTTDHIPVWEYDACYTDDTTCERT